MTELEIKLKNLPRQPGVYLFKNPKNQVLYIGKALSLKDRIKSYFSQTPTDPKTKILVSQIADLDYQIVPSEFEALLLEANLIKKYRPKYNLRLKDDKRYLYIGIAKSPYRVFPTRRPELEKNLFDWFGPFPSAGSVNRVLKIFRRVLPYCSCRKPSRRQCLYFHLNLCPGIENLSSEEYRQDINKIRRILGGKTSLLLKSLEKKMKEAAKKLEFEKAQKLKNQVQALQYVTQGWRTIPKDDLEPSIALIKLKRLLIRHQGIDPITINKIEGYDVSNLGRNIIVGSMAAFTNGHPEKSLYRKFKINLDPKTKDSWSHWEVFQHKKTTVSSDPVSIHQIVRRRLNHPEWLYPQLILVDGGKAQVSAAFKAIKEKGLVNQICLLGLAKKKETIIIPRIKKGEIANWKLLNYSPRSSALQLLQQVRDESHRFAQRYYKHLHLKKTTSFS